MGFYPLFQAEKLAEPLEEAIYVCASASHSGGVDAVASFNSAGAAGGIIGCCVILRRRGYQKMPSTLLHTRRTEWPLDCGTSLPVDGFRTIRQYVFDLPSLNLFECPRLDRLLSEATAEVFLIAGAPLEWTVRTAVLGMLARRHKVAMVSDCIGMWDPYEGDMALRQIESKNVEWLTAEQVAAKFGPAAKNRLSHAAGFLGGRRRGMCLGKAAGGRRVREGRFGSRERVKRKE